MRRTLLRDFAPESSCTERFATPSKLDMKRQSATFAASSTGGAVSDTCSPPAESHRKAFREARGWTRTRSNTAPSRVSIGGFAGVVRMDHSFGPDPHLAKFPLPSCRRPAVILAQR